MLKVAITGNIASGKSQVESIIQSKGFKVIDTDKIAHNLLENDELVINQIKKEFKQDDIFDDKNSISRDKLGNIIFSNLEKKVKLENIMHKRIFSKIEEFFRINEDEKASFVSIPLLFETKSQNMFDKIIFVSTDENTRIQRLIERNNYSYEYAKIRINSQQKEEEKIKKSDFVIHNNSDFNNLENQVNDILVNLNII